MQRTSAEERWQQSLNSLGRSLPKLDAFVVDVNQTDKRLLAAQATTVCGVRFTSKVNRERQVGLAAALHVAWSCRRDADDEGLDRVAVDEQHDLVAVVPFKASAVDVGLFLAVVGG